MYISICIQCHLDPGWQDWLEGLQIKHETDGTSRLLGTLRDQPALYGVLVKLNGLGVTLLSLECGKDLTTRSNTLNRMSSHQ